MLYLFYFESIDMKKILALALLVAASSVFAADSNCSEKKCVVSTYVCDPAKSLFNDSVELAGEHVAFAKEHYIFSGATLSALALLAWNNKAIIIKAAASLIPKKVE